MSGPVVYGLFLGLGFSMAYFWSGPEAYAVIWGLILVQNAVGAVVAWRRTGLLLWTTALVIGAVTSALLLALSARGWRIPFMPLAWNVVVAGLIGSALLCMWGEKRRHPREWAEFKAFMKKKSAWDMLLFRHVPVLREGK